jgi:hypothetical protein
MPIRITHVRFADGLRDHEHITHVAWTSNKTTSQANSCAEIVSWIDDGKGVAYVGTGAQQVRVDTVHPAGRDPYLRTRADGKWTNNLLSLPTF